MKIKHCRQAYDGLVASFPHGNQFQHEGGKRRCRLRISPYNQGSIRHLLSWHIGPCRFPLDMGEYIMFITALIRYFVLSIGVKRSV